MLSSSENENHPTTKVVLCVDIHTPRHDIFLAAFNLFLSTFALLENILILVALYKDSSLRLPSKVMFCCLAITDLCVGLVSQPIFAVELLLQMSEKQHLCYHLSAFAEIVILGFSAVSLMTVTAVSVDRLFALSLGLRYKQIVNLRRVTKVLIFILVFCATGSILKQVWNSKVAFRVLSVGVVVCLITSFYCYVKIFLRLRHHQAQVQGHNQNDQFIGIPLNIQRYRKTVSAALSVQLALVACYLPYAFLLFFPSLIPLSESAQILGRRYTTSIVFVNSSLNPFLYCWKIRGVRKAVKETLTQLLDSMTCCY